MKSFSQLHRLFEHLFLFKADVSLFDKSFFLSLFATTHQCDLQLQELPFGVARFWCDSQVAFLHLGREFQDLMFVEKEFATAGRIVSCGELLEL